MKTVIAMLLLPLLRNLLGKCKHYTRGTSKSLFVC